jgi:hypothetical protein
MNIYIIQGESGKNDFYYNWIVCAFSKKEDAKDYTEKINKWCKDKGIYYNQAGVRKIYETIVYNMSEVSKTDENDFSCPMDPFLKIDNPYGIKYNFIKVELK